MAAVKKTKSLASDFGGSFNSDNWRSEINASTIVTQIDNAAGGIRVNGDVIDTWFKQELSAGDQTTFDGLPASHDSVAKITSDPKQSADGVMLFSAVPQSFDANGDTYQMADRDIKLITGKFDAKASLNIAGADTNGDVSYEANKRGGVGNDIQVAHVVGATGAGNENRALAVSTGTGATAKEITVTFGTDGAGASVTPDATTVQDAVNAHTAASKLVTATKGGTGASDVGTQALTNLAGGTNPSCEDMYMDPGDNLEKPWNEIALVEIYKDSAGSMVACTSGEEAQAVLSCWDICGIDRKDGVTLVPWDIRKGELLVDSSIVTNLFDHRVYAVGAPDIPLAFGGQIAFFDGYLGPLAGKSLSVDNASAKKLDPAKGAGASVIRIWIKHPQGVSNTHIIKLVTYRPPTT